MLRTFGTKCRPLAQRAQRDARDVEARLRIPAQHRVVLVAVEAREHRITRDDDVGRARVAREKRQLADTIAAGQMGDETPVAVPVVRPDFKPPRDHEMHAVGRFALPVQVRSAGDELAVQASGECDQLDVGQRAEKARQQQAQILDEFVVHRDYVWVATLDDACEPVPSTCGKDVPAP